VEKAKKRRPGWFDDTPSRQREKEMERDQPELGTSYKSQRKIFEKSKRKNNQRRKEKEGEEGRRFTSQMAHLGITEDFPPVQE